MLSFRIHAYVQLLFNSRLEEGFDDISLKDLDFKFLSLFERVFFVTMMSYYFLS